MGVEARFVDHSPLPADIHSDENHLVSAKMLYRFWIGLLDEKFLTNEEKIKRANEFFERHFPEESDEWVWLLGYDTKYPKTRAVLIKELAFQDWNRAHDGKRHNSPSPWFNED